MATQAYKPTRIMITPSHRLNILAGAKDVLYAAFEECEILADELIRARRSRFHYYDAAIMRMQGLGEVTTWQPFRGPTIVINNMLGDVPYPQVLPDDRAIGRMAAEHFLKRGFRHFVYAGDRSGFGILRGEGFLEALAKTGIRDVPCPPPGSTNQIVPIRDLIARHPGEPVAVFCCNDWRAHSLISAARMLGLKCPHDLSVIGVDNDHLPSICSHVSISTVELPDYEIGSTAAEIILRMLRGEPAPAEPIVIPPIGVISRESSDRYATRDPMLQRAVRFIEANIQRSISVEDIAKGAGRNVALRTLQRRFRKTFGMTLVDALLHARVERVRKLLAAGNLSIKEIAYVSGFASPSHLSTTFHRIEGVSPGAFRKRVKSDSR